MERGSTSKGPCWYFSNGFCHFGDRCRNLHIRKDENSPTHLMGKFSIGSRRGHSHGLTDSDKTVTNIGRSSGELAITDIAPSDKKNSILNPSNSKKSTFNVNASEYIPPWAYTSGTRKLKDLCQNFITGNCKNDYTCPFIHGKLCKHCNKPSLHPFNSKQRRDHTAKCTIAHEVAKKEALAIMNSKDKICGICLDKIRETGKRFGILEKCNHCYCLGCIRKWRASKNEDFTKNLLRACPQCRIPSGFVIPADYWVEDSNEKSKLFYTYRANTKKKPCRYVQQGTLNDCPFGSRCFYNHNITPGTHRSLAYKSYGRENNRLGNREIAFVRFSTLSDSESDFSVMDSFGSDDEDLNEVNEIIETFGNLMFANWLD